MSENKSLTHDPNVGTGKKKEMKALKPITRYLMKWQIRASIKQKSKSCEFKFIHLNIITYKPLLQLA